VKRTMLQPISYKSGSHTGVMSYGLGFGGIIWLYMTGRWYPWSLFKVGALCLIAPPKPEPYHMTPVRDRSSL